MGKGQSVSHRQGVWVSFLLKGEIWCEVLSSEFTWGSLSDFWGPFQWKFDSIKEICIKRLLCIHRATENTEKKPEP